MESIATNPISGATKSPVYSPIFPWWSDTNMNLDRHVLAQRSLQVKPCRPSERMSCQNAMVNRTLNMHFESILSKWNVLSYSCLSFFLFLTTAVSKIVFFWIKKGKWKEIPAVLHCITYMQPLFRALLSLTCRWWYNEKKEIAEETGNLS